MSNPAKPNQATIVKTLKKGGLELLGKYVNNKTPLKCRCKKCGKIVYPKYNTITQGGGGCKPCGYKKIANQLRLSQAEIMKRLKEKNLELISPKTVTSIEQKIKVKCLICETKQFKTVHQLKHNTGCSKCGHKKGGEKLKTIESVAIEVMRNSGFEPLEKFVRSNSPWKCRCKKCGNTSAPSFKT
jgi:DNA-directed RNA polymerase subunit M/transcription elongation factor TFIIS